jgi:hypothetical protein
MTAPPASSPVSRVPHAFLAEAPRCSIRSPLCSIHFICGRVIWSGKQKIDIRTQRYERQCHLGKEMNFRYHTEKKKILGPNTEANFQIVSNNEFSLWYIPDSHPFG